MGKDKLRKFEENKLFKHIFQPSRSDMTNPSPLFSGKWSEKFGNSNPIILELGCGKGEYTVALSRRYPDRNFIGIDIKGARIWRGAKTVADENIPNAAFLRIRIEFIDNFFAQDEVDEIWITFPDPQINKPRKRLTSPAFLDRYRKFLKSDGAVHLKTDSRMLFNYTLNVINENSFPLLSSYTDISAQNPDDELLSIETFYQAIYSAKGIPVTYLKFKLKNDTTVVSKQ
ncbi:MAG: tRNA (guanosine(46)-N7)-methyltransferase TrmB [Prevotellaceae bacterium]|jgi:tRNA (guanine-N7-)-methyltransferase|nr:tRNA (guanosine(46)-N7)-methyltransferase TrmB [Prevotellaceae bacterium]